MKIKLLFAAAATVVASSAMAQSAFEGFYGQVATGFEANSASNLNYNGSPNSKGGTDNWVSSNQNFSGAPVVLGAGYNFSVAPKWLVGVGADYSLLNQKSTSYSSTTSTTSLNGSTLQMSNRVNIFVTPGYVIDKDKLVYLKAGYSMVSIQQQTPTTVTGGSSGALVNTNSSQTQGGYVVGLGYKQIITDSIYGFAEGNYMSYGKPGFSATQTDGYKISSNPSVSTYQFLVGVGYKF